MKWFPEYMTEVEIEVPDRFARRVTEMLAESGLLEMEDISFLNTDISASRKVDWQAKVNEFTNLERQLLKSMQSLGITPGDPPQKKINMVSEAENVKLFADQVEQETRETSDALKTIQEQIDQLRVYLDLLQPLKDLDIPLDRIRNRRYLYSILGMMPTEKIERFKTSMSKIPFALLILKQHQDRSIVILFGTRQNKDFLNRAARSAYLTGIDIPDEYQGTPGQIIDTIHDQIEGLTIKIGAVNDEVNDLRSSQTHRLVDIYWQVRYSRIMAEALTKYGKLSHGYLIAGWLPNRKLSDLEEKLLAISPGILLDVKDTSSEEEKSHTPISLKKRSFLNGFQKLVTTYGMPRYDELDPTLLMTLTFPVLFGAMFGDVGQGLLLALAGVLLMGRRIKKLIGFANLGSVILLCGICAMVFGFLYGSVFGIEDWIEPVWQRPMDNIMNLLIITFIGGAFLLTLANIVSLINDLKNHHWAHFIFSSKGLAGLSLYLSLLGIVLALIVPAFPVGTGLLMALILLSGVMILMSGFFERLIARKKPYFEGGISVYLIQSFFELFETLINILSNSLSYVRVGAFAVAHAGLSSVIFIMAEMASPGKGFIYWLILVLGNLFIIGFEGMIVSIQTLRLEYYEFFSKFFTGGGRKYQPFRLRKMNDQGD